MTAAPPPFGNRLAESTYVRTLAAILAAGCLFRLLVIVTVPTRPVSDFLEYFRLAGNLVHTGRYDVAPGLPGFSHPPAYPVLISLAFRMAPAGDELRAVKLINIALAALAGLLGATLARRLWGDAAGLWTATWLAFLPRSLLMADLIASENLFTPLLLLFLLLSAASWTRAPSAARAAAIGTTVGLLCLTRSVAYFLPLVWIVGAVAARRPWRRIAGELLVIVALEHAVMLPWALRNARTLGRFTFLNAVGGVGLFIANNPNADGGWGPWVPELERLRPGTMRGGVLAVDDAARQEAWRWIRGHPQRAARLYFKRLWLLATNDGIVADFAILGEATVPPDFPGPVLPGPHPLKTHGELVARILRASGLLLAVAAIGGFAILVRRALDGSVTDRAIAVGFAAAALYIPLLSAAIAVNGRYRWPVEDVIAPLAGLFVASLSRMGSRSRIRNEARSSS